VSFGTLEFAARLSWWPDSLQTRHRAEWQDDEEEAKHQRYRDELRALDLELRGDITARVLAHNRYQHEHGYINRQPRPSHVAEVSVNRGELWVPTKRSRVDRLPGVKLYCTIHFKNGPRAATPIVFLITELTSWKRIAIGSATPYTPEVRLWPQDVERMLVAVDDAMSRAL